MLVMDTDPSAALVPDTAYPDKGMYSKTHPVMIHFDHAVET
jgi:hypothetical protein